MPREFQNCITHNNNKKHLGYLGHDFKTLHLFFCLKELGTLKMIHQRKDTHSFGACFIVTSFRCLKTTSPSKCESLDIEILTLRHVVIIVSL